MFLCAYSYKLNVVIEDATGRAKIFMFGSVAEQVVRRTATELVEKSSSNQILLPGALRALVGRSYVFQAVISEQTFRTGQLCFQARRVFMPPKIQKGGANVAIHDNPKKDTAPTANAAHSSATYKEPGDGSPNLSENPVDHREESTPPHDSHTSTPAKTSSTRGKDVSASGPEEHG